MTRYILTIREGVEMVFYCKECAELYRTLYGGIITVKIT